MRYLAQVAWAGEGADVQNQIFEAALGIAKPWYVKGVDFDAGRKVLTITIDFVVGTRFPAVGMACRWLCKSAQRWRQERVLTAARTAHKRRSLGEARRGIAAPR